jgi:hypothetical protein
MSGEATLRFSIDQAKLDLYTAAAAAQVLGTPRARKGRWEFEQTLDIEEAEDESDADAQAWTYWTDTLRSDLESRLDRDSLDRIEEALEIELNVEHSEDENAEHMSDYMRAAFAW